MGDRYLSSEPRRPGWAEPVFGVSILEFFPEEETPVESKVSALLRAAKDLPEADIDELQKYAEFRKGALDDGRGEGQEEAGPAAP